MYTLDLVIVMGIKKNTDFSKIRLELFFSSFSSNLCLVKSSLRTDKKDLKQVKNHNKELYSAWETDVKLKTDSNNGDNN